jgi:hypothetical protein
MVKPSTPAGELGCELESCVALSFSAFLLNRARSFLNSAGDGVTDDGDDLRERRRSPDTGVDATTSPPLPGVDGSPTTALDAASMGDGTSFLTASAERAWPSPSTDAADLGDAEAPRDLRSFFKSLLAFFRSSVEA